ncbi:MAG TPA: hypothetical protein VI122_13590 [Thermoleophilaceae bacterium]|jgi:hypothetical protein
MGKVWVLDTETKGTGANMVPLEKVQAKPEPRPRKAAPRRAKTDEGRSRAPASTPAREPRTTSTQLPEGHVRKKGTGEIGRVQSIDPKAGTATVRWLKRGAASTVPLTAISRH